MYCQKCGKQLADDVAFCDYCGHKVGSAPTAPQRSAPTAPTPRPQKPHIPLASAPRSASQFAAEQAERVREKSQIFSTHWRDLASSPLVLIIALVFTFIQILSLIALNDTTAVIDMVAGIIALLKSDTAELIRTISSVALYAVIAGNILICISIWITYADGLQKDPSRPLNATGLNIIRIVYFVATIASWALFALILIPLLRPIFDLLEYASDSSLARSMLQELLFYLACLAGAIVAFVMMPMKLLSCMQDSANFGNIDTDYVIVNMFASGFGILFNLYIMVKTSFTLNGLCSCGLSLLVILLLSKYKQMMETITYEISAVDRKHQKATNSAPRPAPSARNASNAVPAWKRVAQQNQNSNTNQNNQNP